MQVFRDKVAVITGAASGIGRALAERAAREKMKVVLADIDETTLHQTESEMRAGGADVLAVVTDVSRAEDMEALAHKTLEAFGAAHLLCNNAGVYTLKRVWESPVADWEWALGVNLWGIIHSIRVFVPIMLDQDTDCHIVNTASAAGLMTGSVAGTYSVAKHAAVCLTETLYYQLAEADAKIKASLFCPGPVRTRILKSGRRRDGDQDRPDPASPEKIQKLEKTREWIRKRKLVMTPTTAADIVFNGIKNDRFYILTHTVFKPVIQWRMENILLERNPVNRERLRSRLLWMILRNLLPLPRIGFLCAKGARAGVKRQLTS